VRLTLPGCDVRDWHPDDAISLAEHANDRRIWVNLRDRFPHPYTLADAHAYLASVALESPRRSFAISIAERAVGAIGFTPGQDVERVSAEIGYWLGVAYWGRGIATLVVRAVTSYAFDSHPELRRIYAIPFAWSAASIRVLEKAGYQLEGTMRQSAIKDGRVTDQLLYAITR
jgi:[ribosomal protein S5]-alanine N-acetyltransferase